MNIRAGLSMAAVGATAVFALAGCGGDDEHASDTAATSAVSSTPTPAAGAAAATGASLADVLTRTVQEGKSAHVTFDMGRQGAGEGDMSINGGAPLMALRVSFGSRTSEIRLVDGVVYMTVPGHDGKFMKMDLGKAGSALGIDPSKALEELQKKSGAFTEVSANHWRASQDGVTTDLFVGDDGYLQKIEVDQGSGNQTIRMTFSDWGKKVTVKAPAAGDIVRGPAI